MLHKKLISLLLIVGLFSSATMHPIWGFDWLFGSSNQTTVNTQKRNDLLFMGSVAAVLGIGIYARYYWNKNKISTQFKHTKESSTPSKHTR